MDISRHYRAFLPLVAGALLVACGGKNDSAGTADTAAMHNDTMATAPATPDTTASMAAPAPMTDANIMAKLAESDSMEIEEGKVARDKAKSADVKAYAKMMIDDHTNMKKEGSELAKRLNITPVPPANDASGSAMAAAMESMKNADAAAFDRMYIDHAVMDHQKVLDDLAAMESQAQNDAIKALIQRARPTVQKHLDRAKEIQGKMGGATM